jgi:hypothetical protein
MVKRVPVEPDPALYAKTKAACLKAQGVWAQAYVLGMFVSETRQKGSVPVGKQCWSRRPPTRLADAAKACSGQSDCIGNCIAQQDPAGSWGPKCQLNAEDPVCGVVLYYGGKYHFVSCPVS